MFKVSLFKPPYKTGVYPHFADEEIIYTYVWPPHFLNYFHISRFVVYKSSNWIIPLYSKKVHHYKVQLSIKAYSILTF